MSLFPYKFDAKFETDLRITVGYEVRAILQFRPSAVLLDATQEAELHVLLKAILWELQRAREDREMTELHDGGSR